ncbi:hypothetical protein AZ20_4231 [Bordetella bronchiseptica E014]|uniref:hypothetical protein n=1 Tax=Bordetella bronchiseptica TaxID=518 RepID=UPI0004A12D6F|nr:hypothetical protein [Bordetella bronchiseptica]KDC22999.1 hypothetical protein AZ20_4231 [Bordetella bronchiseptica E014]
MSTSLIEQSRKRWVTQGDAASLEQINAGSLQRIADATEKMAQRHTELMRERDGYKDLYERSAASVDQLRHSNRSLRGHITKLRQRLAAQQHKGDE